jgi:glycosyltransferase involved in cell wall biosynthesis
VIDSAILRRPAAGTARWVRGLTAALAARQDLDVVSAMGPERHGHGGILYRIPNTARQRWWYDFGINRLARSVKADVLLMPANMSARRGRLPQVVSLLDVNFLTQPGTYEPAMVRYATLLFRRTIRDADALVTISEFSRSEISKHLGADPSRIAVVYPGLDEPMASGPTAAPLGGPYALYVGATERHKNVGLLMDAWAPRGPADLLLAIVGQPGRDHAALARRAAEAHGRVVIRGPVDEVELAAWYRHASVFLFPSRTEGFGYPPLEAMQRGVPVVAANAGSLPEVLGNAALFHDPDDHRAVRVHVESLMQDDTVRDRLVNLGLERVRRYRWDRAGDEMAALLQAAVVGRRHG